VRIKLIRMAATALVLAGCFFGSAQAATAQESTTGYVTPPAFMDLSQDFISFGPRTDGKVSIAQALKDNMANLKTTTETGPLLLVLGSMLYIYDGSGKRLLSYQLRTEPNSGFYEMTSVSHVGAALPYLVMLKNNNGNWKPLLENLLVNIKAVKKVNAVKDNNWLTQLDVPSWRLHVAEIRNMVNYACNMLIDYITPVLEGKKELTNETLRSDLFSGNEAYPIPFDNIMVGTFMLTSLRSLPNLQKAIAPLNLNWEKARVLLAFAPGGNVTASLYKGSSWLFALLRTMSNGRVHSNRIFIAPGIETRPTAGEDKLSEEDYNYYLKTVWAQIYDRIQIGYTAFSTVPTIYVPDRPVLPGDHAMTDAGNIGDFMARLKYSLTTPTEAIANTVAFWMIDELALNNWDPTKVKIPGVTTGFPDGVTAYPNTP
jgi:hypothetical protein